MVMLACNEHLYKTCLMNRIKFGLEPSANGAFYEPFVDLPTDIYDNLKRGDNHPMFLLDTKKPAPFLVVKEVEQGKRLTFLTKSPIKSANSTSATHEKAIFSAVRTVQAVTPQERRDSVLRVLPALDREQDGTLIMKARVMWQQTPASQLAQLAVDRMTETRAHIECRPIRSLLGTAVANISRAGGVMLNANLETEEVSYMSTANGDYGPYQRGFEVETHNVHSYGMQLAYMVGVIAIAHPEHVASD